jgi:uncharacterized protein (TIGR02996 family)
MPTERDFLDAIHAEPDDSTTKRVFADWLEEQGDPRSDLLRWLVRWQDETTDDRFDASQQIEALLRGDAGRRLRRCKGVGDLRPSPSGLFVVDVRGVPGEAQPLPADDWAWVTHLGVRSSDIFLALPRMVGRLAYRPRIEFRPECGSWRALSDIFTSPCWPLVISLDLIGNGLQGVELQSILDTLSSGQLRALYLPHSELDDEAVRVLGWSPKLAGLRVLSLSRNPFGDAGLRALLASPLAADLERCDVSGNNISLAGLEAWLGSRFAPRSDQISFDAAQWHLEAWRPCLAAPGEPPLSTVEEITLTKCSLDEAGLAALARLIGPGRLRRVVLRNCSVDQATWRAFLAAPFLEGLEEAKFEQSALPAGALADLVGASFMGGIIRLVVSDFSEEAVLRFVPYDEGERLLEAGPWFPTDAVSSLVGSPLWQRATHMDFSAVEPHFLMDHLPEGLVGLILHRAWLSDEWVDALLAAPGLATLRELILKGPSVAGGDVERLRQRFPFLDCDE